MRKFYAAEAAYLAAGGYGRADYGDVAVHLDPDVVLHQAPGLPFTGTWRGHEGMERFLTTFSELWESMEFLEQEHWSAHDGDSVVVRSLVRFRARATGRDVDALILQLVTAREGRMVECRPFYWDPAAIGAACG